MGNPEFKIEKDVPIPTGGKWRLMLTELEIGDSILLDPKIYGKTKASLRSALFGTAALIGMKLASRTEGNKVRVWRIK